MFLFFRAYDDDSTGGLAFNDDQLESLFNEQKENLRVYLSKITNSKEAESLADHALRSALTKYQHFQGESNFNLWIYSIATNLALDHIRKKLNIKNIN